MAKFANTGAVSILGLGLAVCFCNAFVPVANVHFSHRQKIKPSRVWNSRESETNELKTVDVVLFGIGDLRTDDHEGLSKSLERASRGGTCCVIPLVILDKESLSNIPGAVAHTIETASMIAEAVGDLKESLTKLNLHLSIYVGSTTCMEGVTKVLTPYLDSSNIALHVCDHGRADNSMGYTPYSNLLKEESLTKGVTLHSWSCNLRTEPWENIDKLPDSYPDYAKEYASECLIPVSVGGSATGDVAMEIDSFSELPTPQQICGHIQQHLALDPSRCEKERNTGMYGSHWGGLQANTVGESRVREMLRVYIEDCKEDDDIFSKIPLNCTRNVKSLEHATMIWNIRGDGSKDTSQAKNMIAGEGLTRFLLAPLFLGTLSPRRLWHSMSSSSPFYANPLRTLVETREWHKLLAGRSLSVSDGTSAKGLDYKYWRWHGFLCRYGQQTVSSSSTPTEKQGILLVHGFGASANQWKKTIGALEEMSDNAETAMECLAPDLVGFGHSEKPPITYSGFTWEAYIGDFIKEIASVKNGWQNLVVGGNSIGGFVSMCAAANDATTNACAISGSGAPGTGLCSGTILMNPAGVIKTKEEISAAAASATDKAPLKSTAQETAIDALAPCKPLPRAVVRALGTGLLAYLRPRIQSICVNLYPTNSAAVDSDLVNNILRDSLDPGAINVMISGSKLPTPRTYNEVIAADFGQSGDPSLVESQFPGPILMTQGILDPLNDAKGRASQFSKLRSGISVVELQAGHCPHDEIPAEVASAVIQWLKDTQSERKAIVASKALTAQAVFQGTNTGR